MGPRFEDVVPTIHHHLVVHRGADVALGAKVLRAIVLRRDGYKVSTGKDRKRGRWGSSGRVHVEVVVATGQVLRTNKGDGTSAWAWIGLGGWGSRRVRARRRGRQSCRSVHEQMWWSGRGLMHGLGGLDGIRCGAHLLDAVADGLELIGKVGAAGVGGVEVALPGKRAHG